MNEDVRYKQMHEVSEDGDTVFLSKGMCVYTYVCYLSEVEVRVWNAMKGKVRVLAHY